MARRIKEEAEQTRARILASALDLFSTKGYSRTTLTDVAARLGMTKGAVYWHFASKEALLLALVDEMQEKFGRQIDRLMPKDELTFTAVADMMTRNAGEILEDAKGRAFFLLMNEQVQWTSASMEKIRTELLQNERFGPWHAFKNAVANDIRKGRVRAEINPDRVAHACLALWSGLVHSRIAGFMSEGLVETLGEAFAGVWHSIRNRETEVV